MYLLCGSVAAAQQYSKHPCFGCHPSEVVRFSESAMGQSLSARFDEPAGRFVHKPSGAVVSISREGNSMHHKVQERGLTADYAIAYSIGYGATGRSYLIDLKGHLFQSPVSFYSLHQEWGASPGYESSPLLDFSRAIDVECLACHAGSIERTPDRVALTPLACDRCHGDAGNHLKNPLPGSIVNPAKLPTRARDSVCEQCHLEGATAVLNPGKTWLDFRPGLPLEAVESHYVLRTGKGDLAAAAAVSHAEQLAVSACLRGSAGKLWCGTCHDPHGPKQDRKTETKHICESCHSQGQLAASHTPGQDDCVACHMPRRLASDISHAAISDHRILKRPLPPATTPRAEVLTVWQPSLPQFAERNLGLAYFHLGRQDQSGQYFRRAYSLLAKQTARSDADGPDGETKAAFGYLLLGSGRANAAVPLFQAATAEKPDGAEYWLDLGVAQEAAGQTRDAIQSLRRSMTSDPYDYRPYKALADLYNKLSQAQQAREVLNSFLKLVPENLTIRSIQ